MFQDKNNNAASPKSELVVAILGLASLAAFSMVNCATASEEIPLPTNINVISPAADLPELLAAFSGKREGVWEGYVGAILIVEEINAKEAKIIYAWGSHPRWRDMRPGYGRYAAKVIPGAKSRLEFLAPNGTLFCFEMQKDYTVHGFLEAPRGYRNRITMVR